MAGVLRQECRGHERRESDGSLTLSRRSSLVPPTLKSERSRLARRLSALATKQAKQNFSEQEQKTISKFSSLNYAPTHSIVFMRWLSSHGGYSLVQVQRWFLCIMIGLVTGFVAWLLKQFTQLLLSFKWNRTKAFIEDSYLFDAWGWNCAMSVLFVAISSFLVVVIHPPAVGGGTPEVIAFLNGILVHDALRMKYLLVKFLSLVFSVAGNLPVGTQGPLISYGSIIGAGVGDFRSKALGFNPNLFSRFRNSEDRREFTTAGVAAGVAAGFNAPVGGLLFAMEDLTSFWGRRIAWQTFICATIATACAQLLNKAFESFVFQGSFGRLDNNAARKPIELHIACIIVAILMGLMGGILGAIFTRLNSMVIMSIYGTFLPLGFPCMELKLNAESNNCLHEISGALFGRAFGIAAQSIFTSVTGEAIPTEGIWLWIDPGLFAIMGSASFLGGVTRLTLATSVIIIEMSSNLDLIIPIMITNFIAKLMADSLAKPLFVNDLDAKLLPFLAQEPIIAVNDHIVNLELYKARDVMTSPVWTIRSCETISALAKLLIETDHEGFPVVKCDESAGTELAYGMITRTELYVILCSSEVYDETGPGTTVTPDISYDELSVDIIHDPETAIERVRSYTRFAVHNSIFVDLEPFINISAPKVDEDYSLHRTYQIFRTLGLRHLIVIDIHNQVVGIITRQDLLPFYIQRRLEQRIRLVTLDSDPDDEDTVLPAITVELSVVSKQEVDPSESHANPAFLSDARTEEALRNVDSDSLRSNGRSIVDLGNTML
ncbi:hypothetical protein CAPTEDRAFT_205672 [Capitella teleta]|uniref:Chloride channel protein n=1 Tax=Capitella teleta TaxID=283909 RepID=R7T9F7_CAPTE|nr:hypothetical protein CAPTEDRAFT_205672 [Capitella teleta]|eukprot:ELT90363.1 hypothetical protein CAPTEDRAFT_205672 [Capitella teleta]